MAKGRPIKNLKGQEFGKLSPDTYETIKDDNGVSRTIWTCFCKCGNPDPVKVRSNHLTSGRIQSCGCHRREASRQRMLEMRQKEISV